MKLSRILIFIIVGAILGSTITYLVCSNNKSNPKENVNYFTESGKLILPLEEKYLVGNSGDEKLYIEFNDDYFKIKEGEEFQYKKAVKSTNGEFAENHNAIQYELKEGKYVVSYEISDKHDASIKRQYVKLLTVTK